MEATHPDFMSHMSNELDKVDQLGWFEINQQGCHESWDVDCNRRSRRIDNPAKRKACLQDGDLVTALGIEQATHRFPNDLMSAHDVHRD